MWKQIHTWIGLGLSILLFIMALTGAILATQPLSDAIMIKSTIDNQSVADVVHTIEDAHPRITPQRLRISSNGEAILTFSQRNRLREKTISLQTGEFLPSHKESELYSFVKELHRSFLLGESGRLIPAISVLAMLLLGLSGLITLYRKLGSLKSFFMPLSWKGWANLHSTLGRWIVIPLFIVIFSGIWLSSITFKFISTGEDTPPTYPESVEQLEYVPAWTLEGLKDQSIKNVKEVIFPVPEDWFDVWTIKTDKQYIFVDQFTGKILSQEKLSIWAIILDWIMVLHTGKGTIVWAILLFISAISIPAFIVSGIVIWTKGIKYKKGGLKHQASSHQAGILIAVGTESGSTWGFAKALHQGLHELGENVRSIEINKIAQHYPKLHTLIVLTSTYGDGDAPASATKFASQLCKLNDHNICYTTLAFGDRAFPQFCAFGKKVDAILSKQFSPLLPITLIDKQSAQSFSLWCKQLGEKLGYILDISYSPERPKTHTFTLKDKDIFGESMDVTLAKLIFNGNKLPFHQAGDWLAVYPPQCNVPRLYSLGSIGKLDKTIEICVRKQPNGFCSSWLCNLSQGDQISANIIHNPNFHPPKKGALLLIGAGSGIAPFIGMIRHNNTKRPIYLFWGGRHPDVDHIYGDEIKEWLMDKRLTHFYPAWSRLNQGEYIQHILSQQHKLLEEQLRAGVTIMVCGSKIMANDIQAIIEQCAQNVGLSLITLKRQKRFLEDIY